jgi:hypothetical protein
LFRFRNKIRYIIPQRTSAAIIVAEVFMSTESVLDELRRKKRCIERAIRALERLQKVEQDDHLSPQKEDTSNLVAIRQPRQG